MEDKVYIKVNMDNIISNYKNIKEHYSKYKYYMADVSGNAYGHGLFEVSKTLVKKGINYLIVDNMEDALNLRKKLKYIPIICKEEIELEDVSKAVLNNISIMVKTELFFIELMKVNISKLLKIHLYLDLENIETGLSSNLKEKVDIIFEHPNIYIEGLYANLNNSCDIIQTDFDSQINNLLFLTKDIDLEEFDVINIYNSKDLFCHKKLVMANTVRLEEALYGYVSGEIPITIKPGFEFISKVESVFELKKDQILDDSYKANTNIIVAKLPIGINNGLNEEDRGRNVSVLGRRFKIIGNITDFCHIYVDDTIKIDDEITIIGGIITVKEVCDYLGITTFELLSSLPRKIKRIYLKRSGFDLLK